MAIHRGFDENEPVRPESIGRLDLERNVRSNLLAIGTLACPECDAPVAPGERPLAPADGLACPVCSRYGAVREFLSLSSPARPARVAVRLVRRAAITVTRT